MLAAPVIPFLLATVITPELSNEDAMKSIPTYTFDVCINTSYTNVGWHLREVNATLAVNMKCSPYSLRSLKCYMYRNQYMSNSDIILTPSSLDFIQKRFIIMFDNNGVKDYLIEDKNVANKSSLLEVYRMIGDHLNIGFNVDNGVILKGYEFWATERSAIANCPTHYQILRGQNFNTNYYRLRSLIDSLNFDRNQREEWRINKYRMKRECVPLTDYFLGQKLWHDFTLAPEFTVRMVNSTAMMLLASREFCSNSENVFHIRDKADNVLATISERIEVTLESVEM